MHVISKLLSGRYRAMSGSQVLLRSPSSLPHLTGSMQAAPGCLKHPQSSGTPYLRLVHLPSITYIEMCASFSPGHISLRGSQIYIHAQHITSAISVHVFAVLVEASTTRPHSMLPWSHAGPRNPPHSRGNCAPLRAIVWVQTAGLWTDNRSQAAML